MNLPIENVVICGEITNVQKKSYKRKMTKKGEEIEKATLKDGAKSLEFVLGEIKNA